jgi:hypothetical protein
MGFNIFGYTLYRVVVVQEPFHHHGKSAAGELFGRNVNRLEQHDKQRDQQQAQEAEVSPAADATSIITVIVPRYFSGNIFDYFITHDHFLCSFRSTIVAAYPVDLHWKEAT